MPIVSKEQLYSLDNTSNKGMIKSKKHFLTNINLSQQKANAYYTKTNAILIYRVVVVLYLCLKQRQFMRYQATKLQQLKVVREVVDKLQEQYQHTPIYNNVIVGEADQQGKRTTPARYFRVIFKILRNTLLLILIMPTYSEDLLIKALAAYQNSEYTSI